MNMLWKRAGLSAFMILVLLLSGCPNPSDSGGGGGNGDPLALSGTVNIVGSVSVGGTLTADISTLEGTGAVSYQWIRDESTVLTGAVTESYEPKAADYDRLLKVRVSRADCTGTVTSDPVGPVSLAADNVAWAVHETTKYFSLSQGVEIDASKSNTAEWDVAIQAEGGFCYVLTNSGVTALSRGSGGNGGVWFTTKGTGFSAVTLADRVTDFTGANAEYEPYVTDVTRYMLGMNAALGGPMNIMTYYGFLTGDGLTPGTGFGWSDPGPPSDPFFEFNKKAYAYVEGGMPPPWFPSQEVYVIRHADGVSYSKFQIYALKYQRGYTFLLSFKFKKL
jgi:hypothetical protein